MKTLLAITLFLLLCNCPSVYGADEFGKYSCDWCAVSEDGYTIPRQLFVQSLLHPSANSAFSGHQYVEIIFMYQRDILDRLDKVTSGDVSAILNCTLKLNDSQREKITDFLAHSIISDPSFSVDGLFKTNCHNYNKIAVQFERNGFKDQAENIYRKVLRECNKFQGCFREAEISLQTMRSQK
jgi:hypothetical protein